jgi:hypothetical protein
VFCCFSAAVLSVCLYLSISSSVPSATIAIQNAKMFAQTAPLNFRYIPFHTCLLYECTRRTSSSQPENHSHESAQEVSRRHVAIRAWRRHGNGRLHRANEATVWWQPDVDEMAAMSTADGRAADMKRRIAAMPFSRRSRIDGLRESPRSADGAAIGSLSAARVATALAAAACTCTLLVAACVSNPQCTDSPSRSPSAHVRERENRSTWQRSQEATAAQCTRRSVAKVDADAGSGDCNANN